MFEHGQFVVLEIIRDVKMSTPANTDEISAPYPHPNPEKLKQKEAINALAVSFRIEIIFVHSQIAAWRRVFCQVCCFSVNSSFCEGQNGINLGILKRCRRLMHILSFISFFFLSFQRLAAVH